MNPELSGTSLGAGTWLTVASDLDKVPSDFIV